MKRASSQLILASSELLLRQTVLEVDADNCVTKLINLQETQTETASTLFYDGIISAGIVSLKLQNNKVVFLGEDYYCFNLNKPESIPILSDNTKLIIDGETEDPIMFSELLRKAFRFLQHLSLIEIISATCYYPAGIYKKNNQIALGNYIEPILWANCNLPDLKITPQTTLKKLL